jgi:hypothetical protein
MRDAPHTELLDVTRDHSTAGAAAGLPVAWHLG